MARLNKDSIIIINEEIATTYGSFVETTGYSKPALSNWIAGRRIPKNENLDSVRVSTPFERELLKDLYELTDELKRLEVKK